MRGDREPPRVLGDAGERMAAPPAEGTAEAGAGAARGGPERGERRRTGQALGVLLSTEP